jgi:hypothetical protein
VQPVAVLGAVEGAHVPLGVPPSVVTKYDIAPVPGAATPGDQLKITVPAPGVAEATTGTASTPVDTAPLPWPVEVKYA